MTVPPGHWDRIYNPEDGDLPDLATPPWSYFDNPFAVQGAIVGDQLVIDPAGYPVEIFQPETSGTRYDRTAITVAWEGSGHFIISLGINHAGGPRAIVTFGWEHYFDGVGLVWTWVLTADPNVVLAHSDAMTADGPHVMTLEITPGSDIGTVTLDDNSYDVGFTGSWSQVWDARLGTSYSLDPDDDDELASIAIDYIAVRGGEVAGWIVGSIGWD